MKTILRVSLVFLSLTFIHNVDAQEVLDGAFIKETAPTKRVVPYTHVREADVMYYKRLLRIIDLKQKLNLPLYYPLQEINEIGYVRKSLLDIIRESIAAG